MSKYIVQHRRGSAAQWAANDTIIPKEGELVIEIDEENSLHKLKIGDGIHTYAELAYLQAGDEVVTQVLARTLPRIITINLNKDAWESVQYGDNPNITCYKQTMPIDGVTSRTKLNLQPDAIMLAEFQKLNLVFVAENEIDGATNENEITVYSIGDKPLDSYTMQATIVEAELLEETAKVVGIPVGTPVAQSDWNQTDETKGDYIKNKPFEVVDGVLDSESTNPIQNGVVAKEFESIRIDIGDIDAATASATAAAEFAINSSNLADEATVKATDATAAAQQATQNADTATANANAATEAAKVAKQNADTATESANAAAEAARAAATAIGDEIDGVVVKDTTNSVDYIAKLRLVDGKPVIEYVEI